MREIKFRGKRIDNGEWVYGCLTRYSDHMSYIVVDVTENNGTYQVLTETVGQYTGFKDKRGREIYEGDILETEKMEYSGSGHYIGTVKALGKVVFNNGRYALHLETGAMPYLSFASSFHEVIGNIYEHPHLLKGDKNS